MAESRATGLQRNSMSATETETLWPPRHPTRVRCKPRWQDWNSQPQVECC